MASVNMISVDELFNKKFFIPSYQRGYRWTKTQIDELLDDLYDFISHSKDSNDYYCLQPIIVKAKSNDEWELVDGQQRLTALWLISALYYCSNKDDIVDLKRQEYVLQYEDKPIFSNLFILINQLIEQDSMVKLLPDLESHRKSSIDCTYLIDSINAIASFKKDGKTAKRVLGTIMESIYSVKVIWYLLDSNEDAIQTFTNVNANKIELTNSELIKAVILNQITNNKKNTMQNVAIQWEEIEKKLNNDSFWYYMINEKKEHYSTRIDYLFEIYCAKHNLISQYDNSDHYQIFRAINSELAKQDAESLWQEIQEIFDTLCDWYNNYDFYHIIGILIVVSDANNSSKIISDLYQSYAKSNKNEFKILLLKQLKNIYFSISAKTAFTNFSKDDIRVELEEISCQESDKVRKVLLLYNISLLVNADNKYERFPFDLLKNNTWDIEHINPRSPKGKTDEEKQKWLNSYIDVIDDNALKSEISSCINDGYISFDTIADKILSKLAITDNDSISNLVLLDSHTNRGYKNACFVEKRKKIIEIERTRSHDEKYILLGTKWVFLKGYDNAKQLIVWGASDMKDYLDDIADKIYVMLNGGSKNE